MQAHIIYHVHYFSRQDGYLAHEIRKNILLFSGDSQKVLVVPVDLEKVRSENLFQGRRADSNHLPILRLCAVLIVIVVAVAVGTAVIVHLRLAEIYPLISVHFLISGG